MKSLTGNRRYRGTSVSLGGYGRSRSTDVVILELEEVEEETNEISWRYATFNDLTEESA